MSDLTGDAPLPSPGSAPTSGAQHDVWSRLLAGEITEVFVFGAVYQHLPKQTLGLEPIFSRAYRYNSDGTLRSPQDLGKAARDLAGSRRWIAAGLRPQWAEPFMDQAGAIVFYDTVRSRAERPSASGARSGVIAVLVRYVWYLLVRARIGPRRPDVYQALPAPPWSFWRGDAVSVLERLVLSRFPDKLVHVTSREQIKQLNQVRALPHIG